MGILKVQIPNRFSEEVEYSVKCLLSVFLGLDIEINITNTDDVVIIADTGEVVIKNHFFNGYNTTELYQSANIPQQIDEQEILVNGAKHSIVSLFGSSTLQRKDKRLVLDSDIISSTFFMLSRWEEYANKSRDSHNRFPASEAIARKFEFLERPIVNEFVELLWDLLQEIGCTQDRKKRTYSIVPTHDVDRPFLFNSVMQNIRSIGGFVKRGDFRQLRDFILGYISQNDPWDTHSLFMDLSEKAGVKSHFFFLPKGEDKHDGRYEFDDPRVIQLFKEIKDRGHHIGLHPSYNAYNDLELFREEKSKLERAIGGKVETGRQHYLRFELPKTWQIWDACEMTWDSTLSYADGAGFRCGVCYPFPVFDILNRHALNLYERPLIIMEGTLIGYEGLDIEAAKNKIERLKSQVRKHKGEFVFLYHNSAFFEDKYYKISKELLSSLYS